MSKLTMYTNGTILTMDKDNSVAEAVVAKDDRIVFVGTKKDALNYLKDENESKVFDLQGHTMIPGFIDPHSHFSRVGVDAVSRVALNSPPVGTVTSIEDLLNKLREKAKKAKPGEWIIGIGYDDTLLKEQRHPTRKELDSVSTTNPVWVTHISNHMGSANGMALAISGVDESTPDPEGGVLRRDEDGMLNGVIEESALFLIRKYLPDVSQFIPDAIRAANELYLKVGVTTANDGGVGGILGDRADLCDYLKITDDIQKVRLVLQVWYTRMDEYNSLKFKTDKIRIQGGKLLSDGSLQGYTGYLTKPYHTMAHDDKDYRGYPRFPREKLCQVVKDIHARGLQVYVHCNGDAAIDDVLYAFEQAQKEMPREDCRHVCIHCQTAREDQLDKMTELGVIPSFFVPHVYYWGDRHRNIFLGEERASNLDPCRSALKRDIPFTLHCDAPVVPQNPLLTIWTAVNRVTAEGDPLGADIQSVSPQDALRAYTINCAHQFFLEKEIGSLEPGKLADFTILDNNPLTCEPMMIKDIQVLQTIVGGDVLYIK